MPRVTLDDISMAIYGRLEANKQDLLPLKVTGKKEFKHNNQMYAHVMLSPNETYPDSIDGGDVLPGILEINIYFLRGKGEMDVNAEAQRFLDLFPRDEQFDGVRITRTGSILGTVEDRENKDWFYRPVLIDYEADSCQAK